ncbi:Protein spt10 [Paraconiothyrium brasiliense]|uniref:Protein spt10 n=1 Tax=Paraconiothyrium brasiliense TaxID=300254 RepID=A0ABR3RG57_9PLEO
MGFKRLGRVKGCGNLKSYPGELVDAIIYGRDLGQDDDFVSEERFDKIRFYLKNGKYPHGADRAEKSRLRSAATHYKLYPASSIGPERLMLKGKEVISDPQRQYEIARDVHHKAHGGINKTTATIAESFHWVRIKETVSQVIRNCPECSEMNKGLAIERLRTGQPTRWATQLQQEPVDSQTTPPLPKQFASPTPPRPLERPNSPSTQLQMEAAATHQDFYDFSGQHSNYDLPVDPALMNGVTPSLNLENIPPSPFLNANQNVGQSLTQIPNMNLPSTVVPGLDAPTMHDVTMNGTAERAPTAREELRRRLTRAGYAKLSSA